MTQLKSFSSPVDASGIEARFGLRMAAMLNEQADRTPHDISERLRVAREQAIARARTSRQLAAAPATATQRLGRAGNALMLGGGNPWFSRLATALPLLLLVVGLMVIDELHDRQQIQAAAEVDVALLGDELPPDAYRDAGFVEFLKSRE
ncbi:MAG: hypothetical protein CFE46_07890 [Burkholderiales bacterium PBB6]|nr:MAG: hypothetical protein CFE46_07890 [Burkholderiales bacterium PBB6]